MSTRVGQILSEDGVRLVAVRLLASATLMTLAASIESPARAVSPRAERVGGSFAVSAKRPHRKQAKLSAADIREGEQRLLDLGYWTGPIDGVLDAGCRQALIAFQKTEGRTRTGRLSLKELEALRSATRPQPFEGGPFHVEVDLVRQVLFIVDDAGTVSRILSVSTGNNKEFETSEGTLTAVTPRGRFKVSRKIPGWRKSELGLMYYPSYIVGGIAIHGSQSVPAYPASHGCIRIPMHAAKEFSDITPIGTLVIVHDSSPQK
ncbi:MAG: L,D-transpeptidase family protein [Acidobacteriota bacterium]